MSDITFRAYDVAEKKMYYGVENAYDTLGDMYDRDGNPIEYYWSSFRDVLADAREGALILMQSSGVCDRTGKKMYAKDVILVHDKIFGDYKKVVEYELGEITNGWNVARSYTPISEIIGNVVENPELTEVSHG